MQDLDLLCLLLENQNGPSASSIQQACCMHSSISDHVSQHHQTQIQLHQAWLSFQDLDYPSYVIVSGYNTTDQAGGHLGNIEKQLCCHISPCT